MAAFSFLKKYSLLLLGSLLSIVAYCTTITSTTSGNWNVGSTWSGGVVPSSTDTVGILAGHTVTVTGTHTCDAVQVQNGLLSSASLVIANGANLTVNNDFFVAIIVGTLGGNSSLNILGTLNIGGNLTLESIVTLLSGVGSVNVGDGSHSGTLNVTGDLVMLNSFVSALGTINKLQLRHGDITIDGDISFQSGGVALLASNVLSINDDGAYDGLAKSISFAGTNIDLESGTVEIIDANSNGSISFSYTGTSAQLLETTNISYKDVHIQNSDYVYLDASPSNSDISNEIIIDNGGTLQISDANNLDALTGASDKVQIKNGGRLRLTAPAFSNGLPVGLITSEALGIVEFQNNSGSAATVFQESIDYPIVQLTGTDEKQYTSSSNEIDDTSTKVGRLELLEGTLSIDNNLDLELNTSYGDGTFFVDSATTVQVEGNFSNLSAYGDFHRYSTWEYNKSGQMQDIYAFTTNGVTPEPYGILKLSTASGVNVKRDVDEDIHIENNLQIGAQITLNIKTGAYVHLLSDASYTAFVKEIPSTGSITYNGSSAIIAYKYLYFSGYSAPDFSTAMQVQGLSMINNAGIQMRGFPGSNKPGNRFSSVSTYTESDTGNVNQGFAKPDSIDDLIIDRNGSNKITRSAYRVNVDPGAYTLLDTGEINLKEQTLELTFTHNASNDNSYRTSADGYNFVGNPYAAPLNWNAIVNDPDNAALFAGGVSSTMYVYKYFDRVAQEPGGNSGYGYYNAGTKEEYAQDSIIPAHQGFWIKTYDASSTSLTYDLKIKESHKMDFEESRNYKSRKSGGKKLNKGLIHFENSSAQGDDIFFHFFDQATTVYDPKYDVPRFGSPSQSRPFVEFANTEGTPLGLYINAIGQDEIGQEIPLYINAPAAGNYTLSLLQLNTFLSTYPCITLKDTIENKTYTLSNTFELNLAFSQPYSGVRFILQFVKSTADLVSSAPVKCFGEKNGEITLPLNALKDDHSYSLWENGFIVQEQSGPIDSVHFKNLKTGDYQIINNNQTGSCEFSSIDITVQSPAKLLSSFTLSSTNINVNESVDVVLVGNAFSYQTSIENKTYSATNFSHTFTKPGDFTISVLAQNEDQTCAESSNKTITVLEATGIGEYEHNNYTIANGYLHVNNAVSQVDIYTISGQLIKTYSTGNSAIQLLKGLHIYQVKTADAKYTLKINKP